MHKILATTWILGIALAIGFGLFSLYNIGHPTGVLGADLRVLFPIQGGTGIGTATAGDVGNCLTVSDDAPFTYALGPCGTGGGGGGGTNYWNYITGFLSPATTTDTVRANNFVATGTTATSTFAGNVSVSGNTQLGTTTTSMLNGVIVVDGVHYAQTGAGIQSAYNDCAARGGGQIFLPTHLYLVSTTISVPFDAKCLLVGPKFIKGNGGGAEIRATASMTNLIEIVGNTASLNSDLSHDNGFSHVYLNGNNNVTNVLYLKNTDYVAIDWVRITGGVNGIMTAYDGVHPPTSGTKPGALIVDNSIIEIRDNQGGYNIAFNDQTQSWVTNTWFEGIASSTILVASSTKIRFLGNEFNASDVSITFADSADAGTNNITVTGNKFNPGLTAQICVDSRTNLSDSAYTSFIGNSYASGIPCTLVRQGEVVIQPFITLNNGDISLDPHGTGKVGVGTTSPLSMLTVEASTPSLTIYDTAQTTYAAGLWTIQNITSSLRFFLGQLAVSASEYFRLDTNGATAKGIRVQDTSGGLFTGTTLTSFPVTGSSYFNNGGNVGIGTTTPQSKLTVAGDAYIGGNLTATGTATIGTLTGLLKGTSGLVGTASAGTDYEVPLTFSNGLTRTTNNIAPTSGYTIPLTASTTNWNNFWDTPSTRITAGTGLSWSTNTLNCATASGSTQGCLTNTDWNIFNNKLASTSIDTSSELATILTDETGTAGNLVFSGNPLLAGFRSSASSTIGDGTGAGGLTINGGATTTGTLRVGAPFASESGELRVNGSVVASDSFNIPGLTSLSLGSLYNAGTFNLVGWNGTSQVNLLNTQNAGTTGIGVNFPSGNVGIGTTTPSRLLTVQGDGYFLNNITAASSTLGNATSTTLGSTGGVNFFGGGLKTTSNSFCIQLTGSADLCDGVDGGGAGGSSNWMKNADLSAITPTTTVGIIVNASSSIDSLFVRNGTTTNATSTNLFSALGTFTNLVVNTLSTFLNVVVTGLLDVGGGVLEIPNGTAPVIDSIGEIGIDSTDDQLILADGAGTARVFGTDEFRVVSLTMASSSLQFDSGDLLAVLGNKDGLEITQFRCYVVGGTSKVVNLTDGTNDTETITCGTTMTSDTDVATNDTFTADEIGSLEMGATTGTVNYLHFEAWARITRE